MQNASASTITAMDHPAFWLPHTVNDPIMDPWNAKAQATETTRGVRYDHTIHGVQADVLFGCKCMGELQRRVHTLFE
jgi:hypothetical protein